MTDAAGTATTVFAGVATSVSAGFIAWQIWLTRRTVEATEETLRVARAEFERGRFLQYEAERARIDAMMPLISVSIHSTSGRAVLTDEPASDEGPVLVPEDREFALSADRGVKITTYVEVTIAIGGPRRAELGISASSPADPSSNPRMVVLAPGESRVERIERTHWLSEWIEIYERHQRGELNEPHIGEISNVYPGDVGASESHQIRQYGSVVVPDPTRHGTVSGGSPRIPRTSTVRVSGTSPPTYCHLLGSTTPVALKGDYCCRLNLSSGDIVSIEVLPTPRNPEISTEWFSPKSRVRKTAVSLRLA